MLLSLPSASCGPSRLPIGPHPPFFSSNILYIYLFIVLWSRDLGVLQVRQLWLLLCVPLTLIDTSNHKSQPFSVLSMETKPERHHRHDHVHEEAREGEDDAVAMEHGALSLQRGGATLFGWRQDEEAGRRRRRVEIREVDFFSRDSRARSHDDAGGGRDDVNVSTPRSRWTASCWRAAAFADC